jgi:hypothetical protein
LSSADVDLLEAEFDFIKYGFIKYDAYDETDWFFIPFERSSLDYEGNGIGITNGVPSSKEKELVLTKPTLALIKPVKFTNEEISDNIHRLIRESPVKKYEDLEDGEGPAEYYMDKQDYLYLVTLAKNHMANDLVKMAIAHGRGGKWLAIYYQ